MLGERSLPAAPSSKSQLSGWVTKGGEHRENDDKGNQCLALRLKWGSTRKH